MADKQLFVFLDGALVGMLSQTRNGEVEFSYEDEWRFNPSATPLSLSMPLTRAQYAHDVVGPFLDGLLPDNNDVRERWGKEFSASARNPFSLLMHVGHDVPGAMQFLTDPDVSTNDAVDWLGEDEISRHIRELRRDPSAWHFRNADGRFSLAGAQRKFGNVNSIWPHFARLIWPHP